MNDDQLQTYANELAQKFIITDGHVDLPFRLKESSFTKDSIAIITSTKKGNFDFERAKKGGLDAPFMSIYIPSRYQQQADYKIDVELLLRQFVITTAIGIAFEYSDFKIV